MNWALHVSNANCYRCYQLKDRGRQSFHIGRFHNDITNVKSYEGLYLSTTADIGFGNLSIGSCARAEIAPAAYD